MQKGHGSPVKNISYIQKSVYNLPILIKGYLW